MTFRNVYQDAQRAAAYARLEFPGTYYLAYRDLPALISSHATGRRALDFGCGTGRSSRFLKRLGFTVTGIDISGAMVALARERDPEGDYREIDDGDFTSLRDVTFALILSCFTFDNIPTHEKKVRLFEGLRTLLAPAGVIISVVSSPEIYRHEWASFSTRNFPQNNRAKCGDPVQIIMTDVEDRRPVDDIIWTEPGYRRVYHDAGLRVVGLHKPLGKADEPYAWINETRIAPWTIYVLKGKSA